MDNNTLYYTSQEADISLTSVMKLITGATTGLGAGLVCKALSTTLMNIGTKSAKINIPGGDVSLMYNYRGVRHESDGDYYEFDLKAILHIDK